MCLIFLLNDLACFSFRSAAAAEPVQQSLQKNLNPHRGSGQADIDEGQIESGNKNGGYFFAQRVQSFCREPATCHRTACCSPLLRGAETGGAAGGGSFHDLRHTFATMALQNGVDVKTVSSMLVHYSAGFTLDTYAHVTTDAQLKAAQTMGNILSRAV